MIIPMSLKRIRQLPPKRFMAVGYFSKQFFLWVFFFLYLIVPVHAQMQNLRDVYERAVNAYNKQQYDQAMDLYQQLIKASPSFAPAYNGMALVIQASTGDEDKTIEYLKLAVGFDHKMTQAYVNLGRIYYGRQDFDHAQEYFEDALKLDPDLTSAQLSLAWINLFVRSKPKTALKYFKMVLAKSQDPKIYYGMGSAYFSSNQRVAAMDMITKLHNLKADDLASKLEDSMRQNGLVNTEPQVHTDSPEQKPGLGPLDSTPNRPTGIQARLRGKLSDY
ncbi:MAG: tetratricopeptide repeat protein [Candidatus Omnitrophica bacterium]|nr:tetratricopeptide repeat protein [Candidatus Omnitrophota bacterium]